MNRRSLFKSLAGIVAGALGARFVKPEIGACLLADDSGLVFTDFYDPDCGNHQLVVTSIRQVSEHKWQARMKVVLLEDGRVPSRVSS